MNPIVIRITQFPMGLIKNSKYSDMRIQKSNAIYYKRYINCTILCLFMDNVVKTSTNKTVFLNSKYDYKEIQFITAPVASKFESDGSISSISTADTSTTSG